MAEYHPRYGICTQVYVTCPIDEKNDYQFYDIKGMGKFPKKDEETVQDHPRQIFAIPVDHSLYYQYASRNRTDQWPLGKTWSLYGHPLKMLENFFLNHLRAVLDEHNFKYELKARGSASRRGKRAWEFRSVEYLVHLEGNGILLKLIGIDNVVKTVWEKVEEDYQKAKAALEEINAEIQRKIQEEAAKLALADGQTSAS